MERRPAPNLPFYFPPDLLRNIIRHLEDDPATLRALRLVCRAWADQVLARLHHVRLNSWEHVCLCKGRRPPALRSVALRVNNEFLPVSSATMSALCCRPGGPVAGPEVRDCLLGGLAGCHADLLGKAVAELAAGLPSLTSLDLATTFPTQERDFSASLPQLQGLQHLRLCDSHCQRLQLGSLASLTSLHLNCFLLASLPDLTPLTALRRLGLLDCHHLDDLRQLSSAGSLLKLTTRRCSSLRTLGQLSALTQLRELDVGDCMSAALPLLPAALPVSLTRLRLARAAPPPALGALSRLRELHLEQTVVDFVERPPDFPPGKLTALTGLVLHGFQSVTTLPEIAPLRALRHLVVCLCPNVTSLPPLGRLAELRSLRVTGCHALARLPADLAALPALRAIDLFDCCSLSHLSGAELPASLEQLRVRQCHALGELPGLSRQAALKCLTLALCPALESVSGLEGATALRTLRLSCCRRLRDVCGIGRGSHGRLADARVEGCPVLSEQVVQALMGLPECRGVMDSGTGTKGAADVP